MKQSISTLKRSLVVLAVFLAATGLAQADFVMYVSDQLADLVHIYNAAGTQIGKISVFDPQGLAFNSSGDLFVANYGSSTVTEYNRSGHLINTINSGVAAPEGLVVDSSGNLYVANYGNSTVTEYDPSGSLKNTITIASGLGTPLGLAVDSSKNLFVSDTANGTVTEYDSSGHLINNPHNPIVGWPTGLAVNSSDDLFIASPWNLIAEYDSGLNGGITITDHVDYPGGLAFNSGGDLFVANLNDITKYDSSGTYLDTINLGYSPSFIAFGPAPVAVPEPSSSVLFGLGALMAGGYAWRKKQRTA